MVFAIGSITPYRRGSSKEHPYGYFLAARRYFGAIQLTGSIDAIQNLLLLARFGMYYHIGRPFAISDDDITVELPFDTNEEDIPITTSELSLLDVRVESQCHPTELSVFIHYTKLRLLSSRINKTFDPSLNTPHIDQNVQLDAPGKVYRDFALYSTRLKEWRDSAPTFTSPSCVFERPEWYDMLLEQERLFLARGAIRKAPKQGGRPPPDILTFYRGCAERVVEQYTVLLDRSLITWTRGSFYLIFTAGLSILYCVSLGGRQDKEVAKTLDACSAILQKLKTEMPDAGKFVVVFEELRKKLVNFSIPANHPPSEGDNADEERIRAQEHPVELSQSDGLPAEANVTTAETQIQRDLGVWGMMALDADNGDGSFSSLHNAPPVGASNLMLQHDASIQPRLTLADWEMDDDLLMRSLEPSYGEFSWGDIDIDQIPFI
ncbi:unnamed protein product [Clonostachys byssicola]|uniref:Uncharacterized protein n=1 Tax=Clonostachys byssicola TaxID=160290 RepID=A0A9N9XTZ6_9HYPO|nr:unnamed protein product [Clonostachys byssicola]